MIASDLFRRGDRTMLIHLCDMKYETMYSFVLSRYESIQYGIRIITAAYCRKGLLSLCQFTLSPFAWLAASQWQQTPLNRHSTERSGSLSFISSFMCHLPLPSGFSSSNYFVLLYVGEVLSSIYTVCVSYQNRYFAISHLSIDVAAP